jgi:isopenicillin N synthase-like dioxygenase
MRGFVPVIDVSAPDAATAVDEACTDVGFFVAVGHGVPSPIVDAAWLAARRFFDLPIEERMRARRDGNPYGFEPVAREALANTMKDGGGARDQKQTFNLGPPMRGPGTGFGAHERIWPTEPYELRPSLLMYYAEMEAMSDRMLGLFARGMGLDDRFFAPFTDRHLSALRVLDYPDSAGGSTAVRAGAHTDYGTFTLLRADMEVGGLEVAGVDRGWLQVPAVEDSFVVNIGDLMHRWSNGRWRSTLHRVVGDPAGRRRNSIAFFHNPNWDALVEPIVLTGDEPPRFDPVRAGPWLQAKVERAQEV